MSKNYNCGVILYSKSTDGHRLAYIGFAEKILKGRRGDLRDMIASPIPVLFLMIEESFILYVVVSLWRNLLGLRTAGLLFRPLPAIEAKTYRLKFKRYILKIMRSYKNISTISIVPATLDKRIAEIADDWIYDFQLWDMGDEDYEKFYTFREHKDSQSNGSIASTVADGHVNARVVSAIGVQDKSKAFDRFALLAATVSRKSGWVFASGGKVRSECAVDKKIFVDSGGVLIDRFVTDDEIIELYAISSLIWCAYSESYNQASGILGRAVQFGVPVIVREGSLSHKFCVYEGYPHLAIDFSNIEYIDPAVFDIDMDEASKRLGLKFRAESLSKLNAALGLDA